MKSVSIIVFLVFLSEKINLSEAQGCGGCGGCKGSLSIPVSLCGSPCCGGCGCGCGCGCPPPICGTLSIPVSLCASPCGGCGGCGCGCCCPPPIKISASACLPGCCGGGCKRKKRSLNILDVILSPRKERQAYPDDYDYPMGPELRQCDCPCPPPMLHRRKYANFRRRSQAFYRRSMDY